MDDLRKATHFATAQSVAIWIVSVPVAAFFSFMYVAAAAAQNVVLNPSFESVGTGIVGGGYTSSNVPTSWTQEGDPSCGYEALFPGEHHVDGLGGHFTIGRQTGPFQAYLPTDGIRILISDERLTNVTCKIYQDVAIPTSATSATLTVAAGAVFFPNGANTTTVSVAVTTPAGAPIATLYTYSSGLGDDPVVDRGPVDLSAYAGQTVRIIATTTVPDTDWSGLEIDNIRLIAGTAPGIDLNQHGLTGSWYETETSGQGFEVEVFPDQSAPGMGSAFVSWFTYDTVVGGAEHQRWYTLTGAVVSGQAEAALTIYQNTGGNFNAPPITNALPVGTATLSFNTCSSGQLAYTFSDATGRTGVIPLTRLTPNVSCTTTTPHPTNADFAHSGNWYAPATSGQGFTVDFNPASGVFMAWYTYASSGAVAGAAGQRWYTAQAGAFAPGTRSIPVQIYQTTGGLFDAPTAPATVQVGSGTLAFQSCSAATFSYNFAGGSNSGLSETITLSRVGPVPPGCAQ